MADMVDGYEEFKILINDYLRTTKNPTYIETTKKMFESRIFSTTPIQEIGNYKITENGNSINYDDPIYKQLVTFYNYSTMEIKSETPGKPLNIIVRPVIEDGVSIESGGKEYILFPGDNPSSPPPTLSPSLPIKSSGGGKESKLLETIKTDFTPEIVELFQELLEKGCIDEYTIIDQTLHFETHETPIDNSSLFQNALSTYVKRKLNIDGVDFNLSEHNELDVKGNGKTSRYYLHVS